ncbi:Arp2/3 complex 16 kDa subunit ARPC5 [Terfezia boudieri ATCC MYA-4762]|uniref:Actin-related protein 2/3 complex subunit 5 n=1 Tax=Terfezia boudieri ATCC MYA-4762 TaxID=1051890 RepID=A0A3N4LSS7_9PEZI|nr:Arp2/3 complex 16 kDa subunit ARPC5 [Terfezia boudieri ATCC MYA-4762]
MSPTLTANYRLIDIDALDADAQFPPELLNPPCPPVGISEIQGLAGQCRQLLQRGDQEGALKVALENVPYGGDEAGKDLHLQTILEILSSIRSSEMANTLSRLSSLPNGTELLDVLTKYIYKGMKDASSGAGSGGKMSVLLSWHEKVVDIAGEGSIVRCMTDRRTV